MPHSGSKMSQALCRRERENHRGQDHVLCYETFVLVPNMFKASPRCFTFRTFELKPGHECLLVSSGVTILCGYADSPEGARLLLEHTGFLTSPYEMTLIRARKWGNYRLCYWPNKLLRALKRECDTALGPGALPPRVRAALVHARLDDAEDRQSLLLAHEYEAVQDALGLMGLRGFQLPPK